MASSSRVFGRTCRALMAAAKSPAGSPTATATAAAATLTATTAVKPRKLIKPIKPVGILKPQPISSALGEFLGTSESSRTDAVKKVWEHIKLNNLQNPANKKEIFCDAKLKTIFDGKDKVGFLEIARLLSQHFGRLS